jgi:hypothetical protein
MSADVDPAPVVRESRSRAYHDGIEANPKNDGKQRPDRRHDGPPFKLDAILARSRQSISNLDHGVSKSGVRVALLHQLA